jgi:hypothetical protein
MQLAKIDSLSRYNELLKYAIKPAPEFPAKLCEFIADEFELQAVVLFKVKEDNTLQVLGKAGDVKKIYVKNTIFTCNSCSHFKNPDTPFNINPDCEVKASEYVLYEGCLIVKMGDDDRALLKVGRKTPFSKSDRENFEFIGGAISTMLKIWLNKDGSFAAPGALCNIITDIAHELRTPTNSIMGFASLLNEEKLTNVQAEYVATLKDSAYNLLALLNDLIDIAKIEASVSKPVVNTINIRSFIN